MSDLMLYAVLDMPYEMAMSDEMSRAQYYVRAREASQRLKLADAEVERLTALVKEREELAEEVDRRIDRHAMQIIDMQSRVAYLSELLAELRAKHP